jgi:hypothetical protein
VNLGREVDVVYAITGPLPATKGKSKGQTARSVEPLVRYLREHEEAGSYLCESLVKLLDENGTSEWQLKLVRRDTRFVMPVEVVDRHAEAFTRVQELTNAEVNSRLLTEVLRNLRGWKAKHQGKNWLLQRNGITEIRIPSSKPLTKNLAIKIAAFQANISFDTLKRSIREIEVARRSE